MEIKDELLGKPMLERIEFIKTSLINSMDFKNEIFIFSGDPSEMKIKVFMVDIDFPIYRLKNIRTKGPQQDYIATNNVEDDFFTRDGESREALRAQHQLLLKIAESDLSASHVNAFKEGAYDIAHPMIMSSNGVLINGNTRMSALRHLYNSDQVNYLRYRKIPIALLPSNLNEKDFRKLELNLQINPDLKKKYSWISEAQDCKEQIEAGVDIDILDAEYDRRSNDISHPKNLLNQLNMAMEYFKIHEETINYSNIEKDQHALFEWYKWRATQGNDLTRQYIIDILCSDLIKQKPKGTGRLYEYISKTAKAYKNNPALYDQSINQLAVDLSSNHDTANNDEPLKKTNEHDGLITNEIVDLDYQESSEFQSETDAYKSGEVDDDYKFMKAIEKEVVSDEIVIPREEVINQIKAKRKIGERIDVIGAIENAVSNMNEEDKRSKDLNLIYRDSIDIKDKAIDCYNRFESGEHEFENLKEAIKELKIAELKIKALYELIEKKVL